LDARAARPVSRFPPDLVDRDQEHSQSRALAEGLAVLVEQKSGSKEGDVLTVETRAPTDRAQPPAGGTATLERPTARIERRLDRQHYAKKANRIVVRHHLGEIVAVIEIVSPGNKDSIQALRDFTEKIAAFLDAGTHVVVDLFPPTKREGSNSVAASYKAGDANGGGRLSPSRYGWAIPSPTCRCF